jgi:hypothetical protein
VHCIDGRRNAGIELRNKAGKTAISSKLSRLSLPIWLAMATIAALRQTQSETNQDKETRQ